MQLTDNDINQLDKLVAADSPERQAQRMEVLTNTVTAMTIVHGRDRTASMLFALADMMTDDSDVDSLHEAFLMRKEMFADLEEL